MKTETPWKWEDSVFDGAVLVGADGEIVIDRRMSGGLGYTAVDDPDNAAFIPQACNSYDATLDALRDMLANVEQYPEQPACRLRGVLVQCVEEMTKGGVS